MSLWYDKKGKTYASKGSSSWVKHYADHLFKTLTGRLEGHYSGSEGKHKASDIIFPGDRTIEQILATKADKVLGVRSDTIEVVVENEEDPNTFKTTAHLNDGSIEVRHIGNNFLGEGLAVLPLVEGRRLCITPASPKDILSKNCFFIPVTTNMFDYAIAKGTHQHMDGSYDPYSLSTCYDMEGLQGQLPVSYNAVKGYVDATIPDWAKQPSKPTYTADEVGALPKGTNIPTKVSDVANDLGYLTEWEVQSLINNAIGAVLGGES